MCHCGVMILNADMRDFILQLFVGGLSWFLVIYIRSLYFKLLGNVV